ncbi:MAG: 1-acyl-sn-glycerol-3-phosphate acyltransferase [Clostridiales bacterium]|nr:1-acyl-sn-glycerol-3-phosphate acyltransferase [Clostridiales bacterium]
MRRMFNFLKVLLYPVATVLVPCKVMDKDKFKKIECGNLIISNHLSWMDVPYQMFWLPGFKRMLSKKENDGGKFKHWFVTNVGIIFIDRDKPELSAMRECINALKNGEIMTIYPEGTRNKVNRDLQELHSGAALLALKGDATVTPVVCHHKGVPFHRNYIGVGDPVNLDDLRGKRIDNDMLIEATARFRTAMEKTLAKLDYWVEHKGWKTDKKEKRRRKRLLKKQYKQAKKAAKSENA